MLNYFVDFDYLMAQVSAVERKNVLCVFRNPARLPETPAGMRFHFLGYDLVDVEDTASALTDCGGFPDVFAASEISSAGLLKDLGRAQEVRAELRRKHPDDHHANCHVWAIFRAMTDSQGEDAR